MILITGATGNIGRELVSLLSRKSTPLRVMTRNADKVSHLPVHIERAIGDFDDHEALREAVRGVKKIFTLPMIGRPQSLQSMVDAAVQNNVEQIVMISSLAPEDTIIGQDHRISEDILRKSALSWTVLRFGAFMSNALWWWRQSITAEGVVYSPTAGARTAPISPLDIAKVSAAALISPHQAGVVYGITGPELLNDREQVEILSSVLGKPIQCVDIPVQVAVENMVRNGVPEKFAAAAAQQLKRIRESGSAEIRNEVEKITGETPQTFKEWCLNHRREFLAGS
jgi:uncharacterized protein YbjT (DUF2867 family)